MSEEATVEIIEMSRAQLPRCAAIAVGAEPLQGYGFTAERLFELLGDALAEPRAELCVATLQQQVVGFTWFVHRGAFDRSGYLRLIAVDDDNRRRGIGRALMLDLERRHLRAGGVVLLASEDNGAARRFYERLGYRDVGRLPDYVGAGLNERIFFKPG